MCIIGETTILQTENGYLPIEKWNGENLLTEKGFKKVNITPIDYTDRAVRIILFGYPDHCLYASSTHIFGVQGLRCPDLGNKGFNICKPYRRCWETCTPNHPNKSAFQNPKEIWIKYTKKVSQFLYPLFVRYDYNIDKNNIIKSYPDYYDKGFIFGSIYDDKTLIRNNNENITYLDPNKRDEYDIFTDKNADYLITKKKSKFNPDIMRYVLYDEKKNIDVNHFLGENPEKFLAFMYGWQAQMKDTKLDSWNYVTIIKNKECIYNVQFLMNYFGIPCAMVPHTSNFYGSNKWSAVWCKNKRQFFYKIMIYNNYMYNQVQKWTPYDRLDIKWFEVKSNEAEYICAPCMIKI